MKIQQTKRHSIYKKLILQDNRSKKLDFNPDGRKHYVYRVTDYTRTEKQHYYGSHTPKKGYKGEDLIREFWSYRTSSKYNTLLIENKENYKVKIIKIFDNPSDKMIYEAFLHQYFNVKLHKAFWNESNQTPFSFDTTGRSPWNLRISPSEYSINKMVTTRIHDNSYITGGAKTSKKLSFIESNGISKAKNRSIKSAKTMNTKNKNTNLTIREEAEIKRQKTMKEVINYNNVEMTRLERNGKVIKDSLKNKIEFRNKEVTVNFMRQKLSSESKLKKGNFYRLLKNNITIDKGISYKVVRRLWNGLIKCENEPASNIRNKKFIIFEGCQIIKEDYINISLLHSEDNGYLEIMNKISKT